MSLNRVFLMGNLGADPELRSTPNGTQICTLKLATNERRKGPDGNPIDHTEWHNVVTFAKTAENCAQYLSKGRPVFVEGRIQTRKYQDSDGKDKYWTEIIASNVTFMNAGSGAPRNNEMGVEKVVTPNQSHSPKGTPAANVPLGGPVSFDDDDIPF